MFESITFCKHRQTIRSGCAALAGVQWSNQERLFEYAFVRTEKIAFETKEVSAARTSNIYRTTETRKKYNSDSRNRHHCENIRFLSIFLKRIEYLWHNYFLATQAKNNNYYVIFVIHIYKNKLCWVRNSRVCI